MSDDDEDCQTCEVAEFQTGDGSLIPVWEDLADYEQGKGPDYLGCTDCHTMKPVEDGQVVD